MAIDDFGTWFEKAKAVYGKGKEMEPLKAVFKECWDNVMELRDVEEAEGKLANMRRMLDNIQDAIEDAKWTLDNASDACGDAMKEMEEED